MPSSLIIVALAAAWLVVLVPMVARSRQEVARPADSALSARVVRSGNVRHERRKEFAMAENAAEHDVRAEDEPVEAVDDYAEDESGADDYAADDYMADDYGYVDEYGDEYEARGDEQDPTQTRHDEERDELRRRPYRPGRGGFDPEAAEIAARAKYVHRQRVVVGLLCTAVVTAILAGVIAPVLWWLHAIVDVSLVGYLAYLRRQVRIENEIRERRTARLGRSGSPRVRGVSELPAHDETDRDERYDDEIRDDGEPCAEAEDDHVQRAPRPMPRPQRRAMPEPIQHNGVYVDLDDEDPAFHDLDQPGEQPFRKAVGQ